MKINLKKPLNLGIFTPVASTSYPFTCNDSVHIIFRYVTDFNTWSPHAPTIHTVLHNKYFTTLHVKEVTTSPGLIATYQKVEQVVVGATVWVAAVDIS
jgi:hypothetical protein